MNVATSPPLSACPTQSTRPISRTYIASMLLAAVVIALLIVALVWVAWTNANTVRELPVAQSAQRKPTPEQAAAIQTSKARRASRRARAARDEALAASDALANRTASR